MKLLFLKNYLSFFYEIDIKILILKRKIYLMFYQSMGLPFTLLLAG